VVDCHFLLLLQKKVTKEKESEKDNQSCFSPVAQSHFPLQKTGMVRAFFGFPARLLKNQYYYKSEGTTFN